MENTIHRFEAAGLGKAPFKVVGCREIIHTAGGVSKAGGTCDFCGTGIRYAFLIESSDGKIFKVGSDCVKRTGDSALERQTKYAKAEYEEEKKNNAGKKIAKAKLEELGLSELWELYESEALDYQLSDMIRFLVRRGYWSDAQERFARKLFLSRSEKKEEETPVDDVREGRYEVVGTVLTRKLKETRFGRQTKILVKVDEGAFKIWGSIPSGIADCESGDKVSFSAEVVRSDQTRNSVSSAARPKRNLLTNKKEG